MRAVPDYRLLRPREERAAVFSSWDTLSSMGTGELLCSALGKLELLEQPKVTANAWRRHVLMKDSVDICSTLPAGLTTNDTHRTNEGSTADSADWHPPRWICLRSDGQCGSVAQVGSRVKALGLERLAVVKAFVFRLVTWTTTRTKELRWHDHQTEDVARSQLFRGEAASDIGNQVGA